MKPTSASPYGHLKKVFVRFLLLLLALSLSSFQAHAEQKNVRIMMDWIIGSTHTPFLIAQDKGYFKNEGVTVDAIDPGKGATNVAVAVAGGAYQFGWVDMPSMIVFNARNPASPLIAVYVSFEQTPLAVFTRKDANVHKPADLNGKKIAGKPGTAGYDTISILLKAAHAENIKIDWQAVDPHLYAIMTKRGEIDGSAGFLNSNIPAAIEAGIKPEDLNVLKYSDYGADLYGLALVTTKKFAQLHQRIGHFRWRNHDPMVDPADPARDFEKANGCRGTMIRVFSS